MTQLPARAYPPKPASAYFYGTCLVDLIYPEAGVSAVELLEREGVRVVYPQAQTCCGQPPFNSGYREEALRVARSQIALFPEPWPVVVPSGSCGAMMRVHYPHLFAGQADEARAREFAGRVYEWSDFVVNVLAVDWRSDGAKGAPAPVRVAYHPSCHLLRELGVDEAPRTLLERLEGVELVTLADERECCGFGGTFSVKQAPISGAMVADKCRAVRESGADVLVSTDCGCLMNIGGALEHSAAREQRRSVTVLPLAEFVRQRLGGVASSGHHAGSGGANAGGAGGARGSKPSAGDTP